MAALLARIQSEIHDRLQVSRAAVREYEILEAALAALGGPVAEREPRSAPAASAQRAVKRPVRKARRAPGGARAARGANRAAVLRVLGERPGVGVSELSAASGVDRPVLYALLARLVERGEIVREELPGGSAGYSLPRAASAFGPSVAAERSPEPSPVQPAVTDRAEDDTSEPHEVSGPAAAAA